MSQPFPEHKYLSGNFAPILFEADIAEYVNYVTPVEGVKAILRKRDPELAENQLIFPSPAYTKNCSFESELGGEMGRNVTKAFNDVLNG